MTANDKNQYYVRKTRAGAKVSVKLAVRDISDINRKTKQLVDCLVLAKNARSEIIEKWSDEGFPGITELAASFHKTEVMIRNKLGQAEAIICKVNSRF